MPLRVVLDTNILVRGVINQRAPSGLILRACETRAIIPLISLPVLAEYRLILNDPELVEKYPQLDEQRVKTVLERLCYVGDILRAMRVRFNFPRDPKDSKIIELAIGGRATHLITTDRDLLELASGHYPVAAQFRRRAPALVVIKPDKFLHHLNNTIDP